jgi:hypothetical protein
VRIPLRVWITLPFYVVGQPYFALKARRTVAQLSEDLDHQVVSQPEPGGWPGYVVQAPTPGIGQRRGSRDVASKACTFLDREYSLLTILCLGRVSDRGDPAAATQKIIDDFSRRGYWSYSPVETESVAGERAYRARFVVARRPLTEWRFAHAGWLFVVGARTTKPGDEAHVLDRARRVLRTWQWLESAPASLT